MKQYLPADFKIPANITKAPHPLVYPSTAEKKVEPFHIKPLADTLISPVCFSSSIPPYIQEITEQHAEISHLPKEARKERQSEEKNQNEAE